MEKVEILDSEDNISEKNRKNRQFVKNTFLIFGIGGLLSWNAILSDINFFINFIPRMDPPVYFPFLNFFLNIIFQFILLFQPKFMTYKKQLLISVMGSAITLILLPIFVIILERNSTINIIITGIIILLQGLLNAVCQYSFFGLVSYFPIDMIVNMSTGQGVAGILMNTIQYTVLIFIGDTNRKFSTIDNDKIVIKGGLVFFSISVIIILICFIFILLVYQNEYFRKKLLLSGEYGIVSQNDAENLIPKDNEKKLNEGKEVSFLDLTKLLLDVNILTTILYLVTFSLFPGACLKFKLYSLTGGFSANTIISLYNIFDTFGRSIVNYFNPTKSLIYLIVLSRIILIFILPLDYYFQCKNYNLNLTSSILVICIILIGTSNGFGSSLLFGIAPTLVPEHIKGKAGSSISFYLMIGIFLGTCSGIFMGHFLQFIKGIK
jgi:equilibrative nucleoside transporter 1/2/3